VLTDRQISLFGIQSHPERFQSTRFKQWLGHCQRNDRAALESEVIEFLRGPDSVKTLDDLGDVWSPIVRSFLSYGPEINKEAAYSIINQNRADEFIDDIPTNYYQYDSGIFAPRTSVADTMLGLAHLKRLSHHSNIDYQSVLRVLTFVERAYALRMRLPELSINRHFEKHILLPSCFFKPDPCEWAVASYPFPFLPDKTGESRGRPASSKGCKSDGNCTCMVNDECVEQRYCCASIRPYVVDLMIVRDSTKCYQPGDLSFIKNVLAGETLSTKHRRLEKTEEISETESERSRYSERDLQIDDKSALHSEINDTVKSDLSIDAGVTANASWGKGVEYELTATSNFSFNKSKESSNKETRDYSKDVIDRAINKLEEKIRTAVKTTRLIETEETNEHGFSNDVGPNVSGQYLYVNKLSRAQVYNYGKKAVIDLYLPEPASLFIKLLAGKFEGVEPAAPKKIDITPAQITPDNYSALVTQYGLKDVPDPPAYHTRVEVMLEGEPGDPKGKNKKSGSHTFSFPCAIPADYVGISMSVNQIRLNYNEGGGVSISASLGPAGNNVFHEDGGSSMYSSPLPQIEGNHTISVHTWDVTNFTWLMTIECDLKAESKSQWQMEVYTKIEQVNQAEIEEYQTAMTKYLEEKAAFEEKEAALRLERYNKNPFINRETERTELKRMAISYISCQFYDQFNAMKNRVQPCGFPEMDIQEAEEEGRIIQFFEQAFNWNLMTYIFYRYFWGRKCTWADKLKVESGDLIFQQFLAAGSAHVLVPIRDGFFDLVQYFLATGEIWGSGGMPPLPTDPHYVSMAQEIKEQKGNYYVDREGTLDVVNGSNIVTLNDTDWYWTYADPLALPPVLAGVNTLNVQADIDREIIIDCKIYRIVDILPNSSVSTPTSWLITLERNYEGDTVTKLKWSTGALFIGAPWEFVTPTTLTFLRDKSACLPCYPLKECKEEGE
jgi:hypothetical protein